MTPVSRLRTALTGEGTPEERRLARPWSGPADPDRVLIMRLQAIGDAVVAQPIAAGLRARYPNATLGFVVGTRAAAVGDTSLRFDEVHSVDLSGGRRARVLAAIAAGLRLRGGWDVVIDLQRNRESRVIRRLVAPRAFGEMDRYGARHGLDRALSAVSAAGLSCEPQLAPHVRPELVARARARLVAEAPGAQRFVLLNPGGVFRTRNWPVDRWLELARRFPLPAAFVITGDPRVNAVADALRAARDLQLVDLVGRSDLAEGLAAVAACDLVITEDGAFSHAAWCGGVPTVALLGSIRSDWVHPRGPRARYRGSEDLPCGGCMQATCARGDVHCLTRITVDDVIALALDALGPT